MNRKQLDILHKSMDESISNTAAAEIGKVDGTPANGAYRVITTSGFERNCQNNTRMKWEDGSWVTVEQVNGSFRITGIASSRGG